MNTGNYITSRSAVTEREKQGRQADSPLTPKVKIKGNRKSSWVNKSISGKAYRAKRRLFDEYESGHFFS